MELVPLGTMVGRLRKPFVLDGTPVGTLSEHGTTLTYEICEVR
jgi:hypothetical protein